MLEIKNLTKNYQVDQTTFSAIDDLTISFPKVQFVSVLGPSGCGKTTLLNCIGGLDNPSQGDILLNGKSLSKMTSKELDSYRNNEIGFVFQNYYLIPQLSVLDNIKIALEVRDYSIREVEKRALEALRKVGLENLKNKKPNQLSGGQAQRVAIARSIVTDPEIILADEPTGALDSENSLSIMELLKELSKDRLVIMVTHNEELARRYSDRIISMKDGKLVHDEVVNKNDSVVDSNQRPLKKSKLSLRMSLKLAMKNILSRKVKTILAGIANSFGMIGIGFFLAINYGFNNYSTNLSSASATSLPVVVSAYNQKSTSEKYSDKNASVKYPDVDEIYPKVDTSSQYSYTYNHFSTKYFAYLDSLIDQGIVREYIQSYGNDYSYNLVTMYPSSINGEKDSSYAEVDTSTTSYNYYASQATLPYNIFHVLYGDLNQYDLICGELPTKEDELVLVVDQYNSVSFKILQKLGFYNSVDKQEDVEDATLSTKVKPIKFTDIIGKEYKVFTNDEYYTSVKTIQRSDGMGNQRTTYHYTKADLTDEFYSSNGKTLKIRGIIRPKKTSPFTILSPALCYLPSLQQTLMKENEETSVAKNIHNNLVFDEDKNVSDFISELEEVVESYEKSESKVLPTTEVNSIFSNYFIYYIYNRTDAAYYGYYNFLKDCRTHGSTLVMDDLLGQDLSDEATLRQQFDKIKKYATSGDVDKLYESVISILAYANAYSEVSSVVIFPVDLTARTKLIEKLDEFNSVDGDTTHALSEEEKVYYVSADANSMVEEVGEMISLVSTILLIFAAISLVVSSSMTALLTSNNVLERKKEIGLLRSLGSRKSDVIRLFEFESVILGALSGLIGSLMTFVLSFPINALLDYYYSSYRIGTICDFTYYHALIIVAFSILVGIIAALIPSVKASRENPVDALRSE
jgi:putative ABC transport system permease protein